MSTNEATRPSETDAGRTWLDNFPSDEVPTARLLIDSLEIHDHAEILTRLRDELVRLREQRDELPASLIAIRSTEDLPVIDRPNHVAYVTYDPGSSFAALPGSEADIGGMSRGLVDNYPELFLSPTLTLNEMKLRKVRSLQLVTDYSGSGRQAERFAQTFLENPTIASWISLGLLRVRVLTYAASLSASTLFRANKHITFTSLTTAKSAAGANWSDTQRAAIENLCRKYVNMSDKQPALGYDDSFGLYLSNLRVPNNLPQILIRAGGDWPGLFANRALPSGFYDQLPSYRPEISLTQTLRNLGAEQLADRIEFSRRPVPGLRALAALHLLDYNLTEDHVFGLLALPADDLRRLKASLISLGLMTLENRVTPAGRAELKRARDRQFRQRRDNQRRPPVDYIPTQLR